MLRLSVGHTLIIHNLSFFFVPPVALADEAVRCVVTNPVENPDESRDDEEIDLQAFDRAVGR